jgi:hypothetical protein
MSAVRHLAALPFLSFLIAGCSSSTGITGTPAAITPVIQWSSPAPVAFGTALSATQLDAVAIIPGGTAQAPGAFTYTPAAGTLLTTAGSQTLSVNFTPIVPSAFNLASGTTTITVNPLAAPSYTWKPVTIVGGGYVDGIIMHPAQKGLMYARTDIGGAYRWNSTTSTWLPLTDFTTRANANYIGIESIGIDPSDAQRLYLAVGTYADSFGSNGAMLLSDDQGNTFTTVPLPIKLGSNDNGRGAGERLAVDPNLGTTIYFGSRNNGLYRSLDRGMTWAQVSSFPVSVATSGVGVVFETYIPSSSSTGTATKTIYAGVSATGTNTDPKSLYVSNDAGVTWNAVPNAPTGLYISHGQLGPDGNLYFVFGDQVGPAGLSTGAIYQYILPTTSTPNGTWNNITPPRANSYQGGYGAVTLDAEAPGTIMVSTLDHYYPNGDDLWRSLNYGKTWYSINTVGAIRNISLSPWVAFGSSSGLTNTGNWVTGLAIDPFNSAHVVHGGGSTVLTTSNITASDNQTTSSNWTIGALGIEETAVLGLISPPSGPASLLSILGDLGGFQHTNFAVSPASGAFANPGFTSGTGIDFAYAQPSIMARVGTGTSPQFGAYSTNSGTTWTPFTANPAGVVNGGGSVAVAADGSAILWAPGDTGAATAYSTNNGVSWAPSTGAPANMTPIADRINPKIFYIYDSSKGVLLTSINGGQTFTTTQTGLPTNGGPLIAGYDVQGDLWLATNSELYHAASQSASLTSVMTVSSAWGVAVGAPSPYFKPLTLFVGGTIAGQAGLFRSSDSGATWSRIDDAAHEYGNIDTLQADPRLFGRIYLGTGGRGILYGDSPY